MQFDDVVFADMLFAGMRYAHMCLGMQEMRQSREL